MTLESIEKLRGWVQHIDENRQLGALAGAGKQGLINIADEIQAEVDEKYMLLPVDADGVPIRVGDRLYHNDEGEFVVNGITFYHNTWRVITNISVFEDGYFDGCKMLWAKDCRHVKLDPVKELLEEFGDWYKHVAGGCDEPGVIDEYAAKIREAVSAE